MYMHMYSYTHTHTRAHTQIRRGAMRPTNEDGRAPKNGAAPRRGMAQTMHSWGAKALLDTLDLYHISG